MIVLRCFKRHFYLPGYEWEIKQDLKKTFDQFENSQNLTILVTWRNGRRILKIYSLESYVFEDYKSIWGNSAFMMLK